MVNPVGGTDNFDRWKPEHLRDHLTIAELAKTVYRSVARIKQLERAGVLPSPIRVRVGEIDGIRLYSPREVVKIKEHFKNVKPGPRAAGRKRKGRAVKA